MVWYFTALVLFILAVALVVWGYIRERRYLKKPVSETMAADVHNDLEQELMDAKARQDKFKAALKEANRK